MPRWVGFLGSWAVLILALGLAAIAIAGETINIRDARRLSRIEVIDQMIDERLGRLHVIVSVKKNGWLAGSFQRFRVNERVEGSGNDLYMLETSSAKIAGNPVRAALDIRFVLALGADAGDTQ